MVSPAIGQHRHLDEKHAPINAASPGHWQERADWLADQIKISSGIWPLPERTPLNPITSTPVNGDGYTAQSLTLETYPGFYLTGTLYIPDGDGPFPAILTAHGHWSEGRFEHSDVASVPGRSLTLARQGYVVLSYSMIGYNETANLFPHRFDEPTYQLWGFSALGLQLWNSLRALDYLASLSFVDANRIGMTGASGGATQTFLLAAIDDRIKAAAPVNMISAHFQGGCICENGPLLRQDANNMEIGAMMAPRPLLLISTSGDWTTNTPGVEYPSIRNIYRLYDAEDRIKNVHLDYPHNYNKDSRRAMYDWFAQWLLDSPVDLVEQHLDLPPEAALTARLPATPIAPEQLFNNFRAAASSHFKNPPASWSEWQAYTTVFGTAFQHIFYSASPPSPPALSSITPDHGGKDAVLIIYPKEERIKAQALADQYITMGKHVALFTPPSEAEAIPPDSIAYWTTYNPTTTMRHVQAIKEAAETLHRQPGIDKVDLHGIGTAGTWALLARTQTTFIRNAHIDFNHIAYEADADYLNHAYIPLLRRAGDFKTAIALTLPSSLTLENLPDGELRSWVVTLYENLGARDLLTLK